MNINASVMLSIIGSILRRSVQCKSIQNWEHMWYKENMADSFPTEKEETTIELLKSPLILTELFQHNLINVSYLTACYLYQVMMTMHF